MIDSKHFKTEKIEVRSQYLHPEMYRIMEEIVDWLSQNDIDAEITETVTTLAEDAAIKRVSSSHREGRAFDLRTRDWPEELKKEFETVFESKYGSLGAVGATTGVPNFLLFHDIGFGEHFHVQLNKKYAMVLPNQLEPLDEGTRKDSK